MGLLNNKEKNKVRTRKKIFTNILIAFIIGLFAIPVGLYFADSYVGKHYAPIMPDESDLMDEPMIIEYTGKSPMDFNALEAYNIASQVLESKDYYKITSKGVIDAQITSQDVSSVFIKDNDTYTSESISNGMVDVAHRTVYKNGGNVSIYEGKKSSGGTSYAWNNTNSVSYDYYKSYYGKSPNYCWSYIISSKTVIGQSKCSCENGLYTYTISLDPTTSTINYKNEIRLASGLKNDPEFKNVQITFTINEDFELQSVSIAESYTMNYVGVKITVTTVNSPLVSIVSYEK